MLLKKPLNLKKPFLWALLFLIGCSSSSWTSDVGQDAEQLQKSRKRSRSVVEDDQILGPGSGPGGQ